MKKKLFLAGLVLAALSCNALPSENGNGEADPKESETDAPLPISLNRKPLHPIVVDYESPFSQVQASNWIAGDYAGVDYTLPVDLVQVGNPAVLLDLMEEQLDFLSRNGFMVMHSQLYSPAIQL